MNMGPAMCTMRKQLEVAGNTEEPLITGAMPSMMEQRAARDWKKMWRALGMGLIPCRVGQLAGREWKDTGVR